MKWKKLKRLMKKKIRKNNIKLILELLKKRQIKVGRMIEIYGGLSIVNGKDQI